MKRYITVTICALALAGCAAKTEATPRGLVGSDPAPATRTATEAPATASEAEPATVTSEPVEPAAPATTEAESASESPSAESPSTEPTTAAPEPLVITPAAQLPPGTVTDPVGTGTASAVGNWELVVGKTDSDALAAVVEAGAEPVTEQDDVAMVLTPVKGLYYGGGAAEASWAQDLTWSWVGPDGDVFPLADSPCSADPIGEPEKVAMDQRTSGAVCIAVPEDQVAGGVWQVMDQTGTWTSYYQGVAG